MTLFHWVLIFKFHSTDKCLSLIYKSKFIHFHYTICLYVAGIASHFEKVFKMPV